MRQLKRKALDSKSTSLKERAVAQYREKDKQVKTSASRDIREYVERLATKAEAAADRRNMKTVYNITMKLLHEWYVFNVIPQMKTAGLVENV